MAQPNPQSDSFEEDHENDEVMLDPADAEEILEEDDDAAMDSGEEEGDERVEEIQLQNDSAAHFDHHKDSIFCIAQHPTKPELVATGAGDDIAYFWDCTPGENRPLLPKSYETTPSQSGERSSLPILATLEGQDESVNAIAFTLPNGDFIATGTLAGSLNIYNTPTSASNSTTAKALATAKEVEEINWILPCPHPSYPNTLAFGAKDGSVWVYTIESGALQLQQTFFLHQAPCTAGAWTPDGKLLATVAEDSSLYVWDVFGEAAAAGVVDSFGGGQTVVALTPADERFNVDGGLYSVAVSPGGGIVAVGGAEGHVRVVGLPRLTVAASSTSTKGMKTGAVAASKAGGGKNVPGPKASTSATAGQAGQILASMQTCSDGIETLDFSHPPLKLLAAGSVDGSIALYDAEHNFIVRRHINPATEDGEAIIKVEFVKRPIGVPNPKGYLLTSCGNDGVVRRWDVRGGTSGTSGQAGTGAQGLVAEWKGHRGGGEGGGVLGFVQGGGGGRIITAGDDGVGLVFDAP